jgi:hypothetical protein
MWVLLAALGSVGLLARVAVVEKSDDPVLRPALQAGRLAKILAASGRRRLTLAEAEDGLVLARRLGRGDLAGKFEKKVSELRKRSKSSAERTGRQLDPGSS